MRLLMPSDEKRPENQSQRNWIQMTSSLSFKDNCTPPNNWCTSKYVSIRTGEAPREKPRYDHLEIMQFASSSPLSSNRRSTTDKRFTFKPLAVYFHHGKQTKRISGLVANEPPSGTWSLEKLDDVLR
jgi:hypothetical protein